MNNYGRRLLLISAIALLLTAINSTISPHAHSQSATTIHISIKNNKFQPGEIRGPANVPITLIVKNLDSSPMEFESVSLRVEKVVPGNAEGVIRLRALSPGRYNFFDDFHPNAQGVLTIQ